MGFILCMPKALDCNRLVKDYDCLFGQVNTEFYGFGGRRDGMVLIFGRNTEQVPLD